MRSLRPTEGWVKNREFGFEKINSKISMSSTIHHCFDDSSEDARLMACLAKSHISEVSKMVSKKATEVHGGMGFTDLLGLHFWFKRIGLNRHILGSPEIVREEAAKIQGL